MKHQRKWTRGLCLLFAMAGLLLTGCTESPERIVKEFYHALYADNILAAEAFCADELTLHLADGSQQQFRDEQLRQLLRGFSDGCKQALPDATYDDVEAYLNFCIDDSEISGDTAIVPSIEKVNLHLARQEGGWVITKIEACP